MTGKSRQLTVVIHCQLPAFMFRVIESHNDVKNHVIVWDFDNFVVFLHTTSNVHPHYNKESSAMRINIANPIYDSVFKYLVEDERIARTLISALLKREVVRVKVRPHEYANTNRDNISMFRIDFAATVVDESGKEKLVLIELQKTWLNTETLRFRQYLGAQYANKDNIVRTDNPKGYAIPMITVYLLGHRVGEIEEPVLYVSHHSYDYDGNVVTVGMPDPFVESLVHDSIIVQIPLLRGQVNNRLEKVLSVFDQTRRDEYDSQVLDIEESEYEDDADMMYILRRLTAAAASARMRLDMDVEDEYYSAIEDRDTALMERERALQERELAIKERDKQLQQKSQEILQKDSQLQQKDEQLEEKNSQLQQMDEQLEEKDSQLQQKDEQLEEKDSQLQQKSQEILQKDSQLQQKSKEILQKDAALYASARAMKEQGMPVSLISSITMLPVEEIERL